MFSVRILYQKLPRNFARLNRERPKTSISLQSAQFGILIVRR